MSKKNAVIFDFNDTLRDKKSGKPNKHVLKKALKDEKEKEVIVLSGESSSKKAGTENWLKDHGLGEAELYVRPEHNTEPDYREKAHILNEKLSKQFKIKKAYDDKSKNVKMFKKHGIKAKKI